MKNTSLKPAWIVLSALAILALLLAACQTAEPSVAPSPTSPPPTPSPAPTTPIVDVAALHNVQWILAAYGDPANPTVVTTDILVTALFTPEGSLSGTSACNSYSTSYTAAPDGTLTVDPTIATTMMACPEKQAEAEAAYLQALPLVRSFNFTPEGNLVLTYESPEGQAGTLVYIKGAVPLTGSQWLLLSYGDPANPTTAEPGSPVTALFTPEGQVGGSAGCNGYTAGYSLDGENLTITQPASTMMMCPFGMEQEAAYLAALYGSKTYTITGQFLSINYEVDGVPGVLTYTSASLPLEGTLWTLSAVDGAPLAVDPAPTAVFVPGESADSGSVSGLAACNQFNADYTLDGENLAIGPIATTRMLCEEPVNQAETDYLEALAGAQSYRVLGHLLQITTGSGVLTYTAERTPLTGALWQLVSLGDVNEPVEPVTGANFTAQFRHGPLSELNSGILAGTTGCNEYSAAYAASLTEIKINLPASTGSQTCAPGLSAQEELYFLALNNATRYSIVGDMLVMPYDDGKQALVFRGTQLDIAERPPLAELDGGFWYLWLINDQPILPGTTITAQVAVNPDGASGTLSGSAGCNTYQAVFGESLSVQTTLTSGQFCANPQGIMQQESTYLSSLSRGYGYWQTGSQLILNTGEGTLTYRTTPPASSADQAHLLAGPNWFLVSYNTTFSVPGTQEPFTKFNADGTLVGNTGCNTFSGSYTTNINQLSISGLNQTLAACPNNALQGQEQAMMAILTSAQTYQVFDNSMQIVGSAGVLNYSLSPLSRPEELVPPNPVIRAPASAPVNTAVTFDATGSTGQVPIVRYSWDFGDGTRATGGVVQKVYSKPGEYRVLMTAIDQRNLQKTASHNITIVAPVQPTPPTAPTKTPQPTVTPTQPPKPTVGPTTEAPTAAPTGVPTQPAPTEVPTQPAPTEVPTQIPTEVPTQLPVIPPTAVVQGPSSGFPGEPVTFSAAASTPGSSPITSYQWTFGDGGSSPASPNPDATYLYNHSGSYQVTVVVTGADGQSSSASLQISINARLNTTVWTLSGVAPGTAITLQFQQGQVSGFAGCNTYTGSYTASDNGDGTFAITVNGMNATTKLACPQQIMNQENNYLSTLGQVTTASIQGSMLALSGSGGQLTYYEVGSPQPR